MIANLHGNLLKNADHRALTDGAMFALKGIVHGQCFNRSLKEIVLIRDEGVALGEVLSIAEIAISLRAIGKIEQCLEIVKLAIVDSGQLCVGFAGLRE